MDGLVLDVPVPSGTSPPLTELLAALPTSHLITGALLILLSIIAVDFANPQRGARR